MNSRELFIAACQNKKTPRPPIWLMRQAGRYMQDYQSLRAKYDFLTMCKTPELAMEVTMQPIQRFGMDAAILFSDILTALEPMGVKLQFTDKKGPQLEIAPDTNEFELKTYEVKEKIAYVPQTLKMLRKALPDKALLGFSGAPFTLATYILEHSHKKAFHSIRIAISEQPQKLHHLLSVLSTQMGQYLAEQILAGADAVQLFDSWAGNLPEEIYTEFVLPYQRQTFETMKQIITKENPDKKQGQNFFTILFIKNYNTKWQLLSETGADVISVDENTKLSVVRQQIINPLQGNLSPYDLFLEKNKLRQRATQMKHELDSTGHIFNLGHGVLPQVSEDQVQLLVETIKS